MTTLKKATDKDREFVRRLKNNCLESSFVNTKISEKSHSVWWKKTTDKIFIIYYGSKKAGYLRIDKDNYISIAVKDKLRHKHIATEAVMSLPKGVYNAKVYLYNLISLKMFENCGFKKAYAVLTKEVK